MTDEDLFAIPAPKPREQQLQNRGGMKEEMADCYGPAHARREDPDTSHRAAREVTPHTDTIRAEVERWAAGQGADGFIDEQLSAAFDATQSSSYRTRRAELTDAGVIYDSGRRRFNQNMRQCIVWVHRTYRRDYVPPDQPLTLTDKLHRHANRLDEWAKGMQGEGRTMFAAGLAETAALIREALEATAKRKKESD